MIGRVIAKAEVDAAFTEAFSTLLKAVSNIARFETWHAGQANADLLALGYSQADIDLMGSCTADGIQLVRIFRGEANLPVAKDFRAFINRIGGLVL